MTIAAQKRIVYAWNKLLTSVDRMMTFDCGRESHYCNIRAQLLMEQSLRSGMKIVNHLAALVSIF